MKPVAASLLALFALVAGPFAANAAAQAMPRPGAAALPRVAFVCRSVATVQAGKGAVAPRDLSGTICSTTTISQPALMHTNGIAG